MNFVKLTLPDLQWHWIDPNFSFSWATFCLVQHVASACVCHSFNEWSASNSLPSCFKVKTWTTFARLAQNTLCPSLSCFVSFGFVQIFFLWISAALGSFDRPGNKRSVGTIGCRFFLKNVRIWKGGNGNIFSTDKNRFYFRSLQNEVLNDFKLNCIFSFPEYLLLRNLKSYWKNNNWWMHLIF